MRILFGVLLGAVSWRVAAPAARLLSAPATSWADPTSAVVALALIGAWVISLWLLACALLVLASGLPGLLGVAGRAVAARAVPAVVHRCLVVALGVALPAVPSASAQAAPPAPTPPAAAFDWPAAVPEATGALAPRHVGPAPVATRAAPATPVVVAAAVPPRVPSPDAVVVRPGDSLWRIAKEHLPAGASAARICTAWPSWWAANRALLGATPDLIHPGTTLRPPSPAGA